MSSDRPVAPDPAPGGGAWAGAWTVPARIKALRVPARIVTAGLGASALGGAWSIYVSALLYDFANDARTAPWSAGLDDRVASIQSMALAAAVFFGLALLGTAAAFIVWFYRCRFNAGLFRPDGNRMSQGWSIGAWFVPLANLWLPKRIANDMWGAAPPSEDGTVPRPPSKVVLNLWWGMWLVAVILERVSNHRMESAVEIEQISSAAAFSIVVEGLFILASGAAIAFVWRLTRLQEARAARLHSMYPAMPPAAPMYGAPAQAPATSPASAYGQPPQPPAPQ